jgi:tRNA threonylcarbamoyladenosine biosynthesis protein TsaE
MLYYRQVETPYSTAENRRAEGIKYFHFSAYFMSSHTYISSSPAATAILGEKTGRILREGSVVALIGELGSGKTLLTRGICEGLGVPLRRVNSPTFVLVNEYQGRMPVFHMDMYQLKTESDAVELDIIDYMARARSGVVIVEWAEKILSMLPDDLLRVDLQILSENKRKIEFSSSGEAYAGLFKELSKA